ncbi:MAG: oxidoreductase [Rhodospirillaceae bacterium]|nr:MAG: oxidoreductase [Rhodospirillaceae bacterium]
MPESFRAYVVDNVDGKYSGGFRQLTDSDLPAEPVLVTVAYSSLNYKDGLAVTGKGKIVKKFPMACGIDLAGTVAESADPAFKPGDPVVVTGRGLSETMWGGYSAKQRINPAYLTRLPRGLTAKQAMAIGTAGFTAMLCVIALEKAGVTPDRGDVLVTGAAGGVGSIAVAVLAKCGYRVVASTGRAQTHDYLKSLGAADFIARTDLDRESRPLESKRWAGVVDSVGSKTLVTAIAQTRDEGAAAACGLVGGADLPGNMMPFILRGVKLLGVNCDTVPNALRDEAWTRLATDLDLAKLEDLTEVEPLSNIEALAAQIVRGETRGRVVIDVNR